MPSEVRFTRAQRLDLVRISAAAVASTVFFTVPMFLVRPGSPPAHIESHTTSPHDVVLASSAEPPTRATALDGNAVAVVTSTEFASATMPSLQGTAGARSHSVKPPQVRARANTPEPAQSLSRRLVRFLAGNGKYNVKPFPTLNSSGS
jgi:hypothetical protein